MSGKTNQINRSVCCLKTNEVGKGMLNIDTFITSKQIKLLYRILHSPLESWNDEANWFVFKSNIRVTE
jgi:hypothetical protein